MVATGICKKDKPPLPHNRFDFISITIFSYIGLKKNVGQILKCFVLMSPWNNLMWTRVQIDVSQVDKGG